MGRWEYEEEVVAAPQGWADDVFMEVFPQFVSGHCGAAEEVVVGQVLELAEGAG